MILDKLIYAKNYYNGHVILTRLLLFNERGNSDRNGVRTVDVPVYREFEHRLFFLMQQNYWLWTDAGEQKTGHGTTNRNGIHGPFCLGFVPTKFVFMHNKLPQLPLTTHRINYTHVFGWIIWLVSTCLHWSHVPYGSDYLWCCFEWALKFGMRPFINITKWVDVCGRLRYAIAENHHKVTHFRQSHFRQYHKECTQTNQNRSSSFRIDGIHLFVYSRFPSMHNAMGKSNSFESFHLNWSIANGILKHK